jgi:glycerol-3-phosphate responsive antiterminator
MSIFNETGLGGALMAGCATSTIIHTTHTTYGQGDTAYNIDKAKVGVLEKVVVKKQRVIQNSKTHGKALVLYVDTFNGLWNEHDLVSFTEAQALAIDYLQGCLSDLEPIDTCS